MGDDSAAPVDHARTPRHRGGVTTQNGARWAMGRPRSAAQLATS